MYAERGHVLPLATACHAQAIEDGVRFARRVPHAPLQRIICTSHRAKGKRLIHWDDSSSTKFKKSGEKLRGEEYMSDKKEDIRDATNTTVRRHKPTGDGGCCCGCCSSRPYGCRGYHRGHDRGSRASHHRPEAQRDLEHGSGQVRVRPPDPCAARAIPYLCPCLCPSWARAPARYCSRRCRCRCCRCWTLRLTPQAASARCSRAPSCAPAT